MDESINKSIFFITDGAYLIAPILEYTNGWYSTTLYQVWLHQGFIKIIEITTPYLLQIPPWLFAEKKGWWLSLYKVDCNVFLRRSFLFLYIFLYFFGVESIPEACWFWTIHWISAQVFSLLWCYAKDIME